MFHGTFNTLRFGFAVIGCVPKTLAPMALGNVIMFGFSKSFYSHLAMKDVSESKDFFGFVALRKCDLVYRKGGAHGIFQLSHVRSVHMAPVLVLPV